MAVSRARAGAERGRSLSHARESSLTCRPLIPDRWDDLVELFGPNGTCAGCWCMFFRQSGREFRQSQGAAKRRAFRRLVDSGAPTGVIAYAGRWPVGWCSVAPRQDYVRLERSRVLARVDERPVWSVVCFYVPARHRRGGVTRRLLEGAIAYAARRGARAIEGYPVDPQGARINSQLAYHGVTAMFRHAGFREVARRSPTRPIMRLELARGSKHG